VLINQQVNVLASQLANNLYIPEGSLHETMVNLFVY